MATQVQFRRGTTGENSSFTGAQGEVTVDITKNTTVVHDGSTLGGFPLLREDGTNMALSSGSLSSCALKFASDVDTGLIRPAENQIAIVTGGTAQLSIDSAGAATFNNNVLISGSLTVSGGISGPTYFSAGSAAAPSITFVGDLNTGIYSPGADQVAITTNGVERLRTSTTGITSTLPIAHPPGAVTAPGITFAGDLNTGFYTPTADTLSFVTNSIEAFRIDSSSRFLIGTDSSRSYAATGPTFVQIESTLFNRSSLGLTNNQATSDSSLIVFGKTRGTSTNSNTIVNNGDFLGAFSFEGADGTQLRRAASIFAAVDGAPGASDMPGRLIFATSADGSASPVERLRIGSSGLISVNSSNHQGGALAAATPAKLLLGTGTYTDTSTAASGTVALGPITTFDNPVIAATNTGVTYTTASTVYIDGEPTAGTNVTITNPFAFYVNAGQSSFPTGTVTAPSLTFATDTNTGIWSPAGDTIAVSTGGSERARIDSSGRLLVGTSSATGQAIVQAQTPTTLSTTADSGIRFANTATKTYPTTANFTIVTGLEQNIELGNAVVVDPTTPGGFNFVYGLRNLLTKSAGNVQDIERLNFNGFDQTFTWTDANTCKQYVGISDVFIYSGIDANGRTSSSFNAQSLLLNPATGGTQTVANVTGFTNINYNSQGTTTVNVTNSRNLLPNLTFANTSAGTKTVNITNHTFFGTSTFWGTSGTTGTLNATITNLYGLRLTAPSASTGLTVTNNWGISQEWSSAKNYFAGSVGIGTTTPGGALEVNAAAATAPAIFKINTAEAARIDSSGRLLVGASSARATRLGSTSITPIVQTTDSGNGGVLVYNNAASANPATIYTAKSRGNDYTSTVQNGDALLRLSAAGADGTQATEAARIEVAVDGTPGADDMPGRLVFSTTADGASSPTERMRISNTGLHTVNSTAHQGPALADATPAKLLLGTGTYTDTATAASGTVVHGPITTFDNPAIAATNATVTYTTASTVYIDGAPTAGTNVTITNPFALFVGSGQTSLPAGTVGLPSLTFGLNKTTGIYSPATNQVAFSTAGVQRLLVDATGNFNFDSNTLYVDGVNNRVGIGTTSPGAAAHVNNATVPQLYLSQNQTDNTSKFSAIVAGQYSSTAEPEGFTIIGSEGTSGLNGVHIGGYFSEANAAQSIAFFTASNSTTRSGSERARIDSSGRLLVGTSNSTDNARFDSKVSVVGTGNGLFPGLIVNGYTGTTNASAAPFIDLGRSRGTTDGSYTEVANNDTLGYIVFRGADGAGWSDGAIILCQADGDWTTSGDTTDSPGRLVFSTTADGASSPTERMRISSYGRLYIDTNAHQGNALSDTAPAKILAGAGTYTDTTTAASGTVVHGPINTFDNPAIAASNTTVTYTTASTVYIDGAPTAGTNVTITNPFALYIGAGQSSFPLGTVGLPSITFGTNKTTGIWSPGTDTIAFSIGGTETLRIDSSDRLLLGLSTARANFFNTTISPLHQQEGTTDQGRGAAIVSSSATAGSGAYLVLAHQKSGALGGNTLVVANDELGHVSFQGSDGTEFVTGASITAEVDGTAAANDMPGRLVFYTTPDGAAVQTEKLRITKEGVSAFRQPAPASFTGAATLTNANLFTGIIDYSVGGAVTLTLPLGTTLETAFSNPYVDIAFEWSVINRGASAITIGANTGSTVSGSGSVAAGASGRFVTRRTAANTFVTYRLA